MATWTEAPLPAVPPPTQLARRARSSGARTLWPALGFSRMDRVIGAAGFSAAVAIYIYYTAWAVLTPFVDENVVWFHSLFPDRW
eukprot:1247982-Prymnesium_polylepis.1